MFTFACSRGLPAWGFALALSSAIAQAAAAAPITDIAHTASGTADAFITGGDFESEADATTATDDLLMRASAFVLTRPGSLGAIASGTSESRITVNTNSVSIRNELRASYSPSFFAGGDEPGGGGSATLDSVIEFVIDAAEVTFDLFAIEILGGTNSGTYSSILENVTDGTTLFSLNTPVGRIFSDVFTVTDSVGDLFRLTTIGEAEASGEPGGSSGTFDTDLFLTITEVGDAVPEPASLTLLGLGLAGLGLVRRRISRSL